MQVIRGILWSVGGLLLAGLAFLIAQGLSAQPVVAGPSSHPSQSTRQASGRPAPSPYSPLWGTGHPAAGLNPSQVAALYQVNQLWSQRAAGQHQPVALIEFSGVASSDIRGFTRFYNYPPVVMHQETFGLPDTAPGLEATLDVEWVHAMAPESPIWIFDLANPADLSKAIAQGLSQGIRVFSLSFATLSPDAYPGGGIAVNRVLQQAAAEGAAVFVSSGDWGPYALNSTSPTEYAVNFPASSPWVVAVGGTRLTSSQQQVAWKYGGGGQSTAFSAPAWQVGVVPNTHRWVPDVAYLAGAPGVSIYWQGRWQVVQGTSIGAPGWAATWADLRSALPKRPPGFPSPLLYQAYQADASAFTEIDRGSNGLYSAHAGWNPVTGLGTPLALNLLHWLQQNP